MSGEMCPEDLSVPCVVCLAEVGEPCSIEPVVHFARRLRRIVEQEKPELLEDPN